MEKELKDLTFKELDTLMGIDKRSSDVVSAFSEEIPFSDLDSDHLNKWFMLDGTVDERKHPFRRYSTYLQNFYIAAERFGYTFKEFKKSGIDGYWLFTHDDLIYYPWISVRPGSVHDEFTLLIRMDFEDRLELKTYDDCYNKIRRSLEFKFKDDKVHLREVKLTDILK